MKDFREALSKEAESVADATGDSTSPPPGVELDDFCATLPKDEVDDDIDHDDDSDTELQIQNAVYMLQRAHAYLAFFAENNHHHKFLTKKSKVTLIDIVDEIGDFLGDFSG